MVGLAALALAMSISMPAPIDDPPPELELRATSMGARTAVPPLCDGDCARTTRYRPGESLPVRTGQNLRFRPGRRATRLSVMPVRADRLGRLTPVAPAIALRPGPTGWRVLWPPDAQRTNAVTVVVTYERARPRTATFALGVAVQRG